MSAPHIADVFFKPLSQHADSRGWLVEIYREDELADSLHPVMAYVSQTLPGVARGPHEHVDQTDLFAFMGPGDFELVLWDARPKSPTYKVQTRTICGQSNLCVDLRQAPCRGPLVGGGTGACARLSFMNAGHRTEQTGQDRGT